MKRSILLYFTISALLCIFGTECLVHCQEYTQTPVSISNDKVKNNGKLYYSHIVLERQTLYSISKAYGVSIEEIYEANPNLHLQTDGLKKYQILLIPIESEKRQNEPHAGNEKHEETAAETAVPEVVVDTKQVLALQEDDYTTHKVKWYEDLKSISEMYSVSEQIIMDYNGLTSAKLSRKMKLKIPRGETLSRLQEDLPVGDTADQGTPEMGEEEPHTEDEHSFPFLFGGKRDITATLLLPLGSRSQISDNMYDFYCGALLAVKALEQEGIHTELHVYDVSSKEYPSEDEIQNSDVIIGPISTSEIGEAMVLCQSDKFIISPLEPKVSALAEANPGIIQTPSTIDSQCQDLIQWLSEELQTGDKVLLFSEKGATPTHNATLLIQSLNSSGIPYSTISYDILEGRNVIDRIEKVASRNGTNRILVASESEAFVNDVIRNVNLMEHREMEAVLYCLSKIRTFDTIEVANFHKANMHISLSYYVDYENNSVKKFLSEYRGLYGTEPNPFAFQGYDTAYEFIKASSQYGRKWAEKIEKQTIKGLQSDIRLERLDSGSLMNKAVRRIVYDDNFIIRMD